MVIKKDGKRIFNISEFYHSNYQELKNEIIKDRVKNLAIKDI